MASDRRGGVGNRGRNVRRGTCLLIAAVALPVSLAAVRAVDGCFRPRRAVVDIARVVRRKSPPRARPGTAETAAARAKIWAARLEKELRRLARERNGAILNAKAVAAGADDLTAELLRRLDRGSEARTPATGSPPRPDGGAGP